MHAAKIELTSERRAIERITRKPTAVAIAAATETSVADEVEMEPDAERHLGGRSCRCPAANVKAYREEGEWVCHTCGHQLSPRVASLLTHPPNRSTAPDQRARADLRLQRRARGPRPAAASSAA
jgi:hypothetical protein